MRGERRRKKKALSTVPPSGSARKLIVGKRPMEYTGPGRLRIVVDSDHGCIGGSLRCFAGCFAIGIALAMVSASRIDRQHLRLFL